MFTVFTYIQPMLTQISGFPIASVSPILLVFGAGLSAGNLLGGRFADRNLRSALVATLGMMIVVLLVMAPAMKLQATAVIAVGLLGPASFATVAPLQLRVLQEAGTAGQTLASSLNIAAFNLGNAIGAWLGGWAIERGPGLAALPLVGAVVTAGGLGLALTSLRRDRQADTPARA
ncbi:MFS transporter [Allosphingosinicella deserti]|uniref:hypothetical protein n=1 Tax=Allosphingosinicella deserti TaxID=2116704 RepID=UPI001E5796A0|nr:hypothetical protein [Sphingomonas deserti]